MMCNSELARKGENLAIFPADRMGNTENLLNLVETSGAEIVVIDDLNGLFLENPASVERFMYRLRNIAARSQTIVFIIYNMSPPKKRGDASIDGSPNIIAITKPIAMSFTSSDISSSNS